MPYRLTINQLSLPEGREVYIAGLGTFANGGTYDISDEQAHSYSVFHTYDDGHWDFDHETKEGSGVYVPVHKLGPHLVEAIDAMHGVTIEEVKPPKPSTPSTPSTPTPSEGSDS